MYRLVQNLEGRRETGPGVARVDELQRIYDGVRVVLATVPLCERWIHETNASAETPCPLPSCDRQGVRNSVRHIKTLLRSFLYSSVLRDSDPGAVVIVWAAYASISTLLLSYDCEPARLLWIPSRDGGASSINKRIENLATPGGFGMFVQQPDSERRLFWAKCWCLYLRQGGDNDTAGFHVNRAAWVCALSSVAASFITGSAECNLPNAAIKQCAARLDSVVCNPESPPRLFDGAVAKALEAFFPLAVQHTQGETCGEAADDPHDTGLRVFKADDPISTLFTAVSQEAALVSRAQAESLPTSKEGWEFLNEYTRDWWRLRAFGTAFDSLVAERGGDLAGDTSGHFYEEYVLQWGAITDPSRLALLKCAKRLGVPRRPIVVVLGAGLYGVQIVEEDGTFAWMRAASAAEAICTWVYSVFVMHAGRTESGLSIETLAEHIGLQLDDGRDDEDDDGHDDGEEDTPM